MSDEKVGVESITLVWDKDGHVQATFSDGITGKHIHATLTSLVRWWNVERGNRKSSVSLPIPESTNVI